MKKDIKYILVILMLLVSNLGFYFFDSISTGETSRKYFDLDTAQIHKITISYKDQEIVLEKSDNWLVNDQYSIDQRFRQTLLTIIDKVIIKRELGKWEDEVLGEVKVEGTERFTFQFASNPNRTKTFFIANEIAKEVEVSGYRDQIVNIFLLHPDQWRDRLMFDGSWRTIQNLELKQRDSEPLHIKFVDKFFKVNGQNVVDSTFTINYLNQFQYFEANEMISKGRFPNLDSLSTQEILAKLTIADIKYSEPVTLEIFPKINNLRYHLVRNQTTREMMVVDEKRVNQILKTKADFLL